MESIGSYLDRVETEFRAFLAWELFVIVGSEDSGVAGFHRGFSKFGSLLGSFS